MRTSARDPRLIVRSGLHCESIVKCVIVRVHVNVHACMGTSQAIYSLTRLRDGLGKNRIFNQRDSAHQKKEECLLERVDGDSNSAGSHSGSTKGHLSNSTHGPGMC